MHFSPFTKLYLLAVPRRRKRANEPIFPGSAVKECLQSWRLRLEGPHSHVGLRIYFQRKENYSERLNGDMQTDCSLHVLRFTLPKQLCVSFHHVLGMLIRFVSPLASRRTSEHQKSRGAPFIPNPQPRFTSSGRDCLTSLAASRWHARCGAEEWEE
ncbi:hypothetical protein WMY93_004072 [Mugilogobius chulae]|uniref:Uncharacterized protein n=1 Tax=Mugilogobius chulae TaxID=88201 RepID=A0AAW0PY69_9GOBI